MKIKVILSEYPGNDNCGVERICIALRQRGIEVSRRTVYRAMKEAGLLHCRRIPHGITKATTEIQEQENIIKRDFTADAPLKKFLTDITDLEKYVALTNLSDFRCSPTAHFLTIPVGFADSTPFQGGL